MLYFFLSMLWRRLNEDPDFKANEHLVSLRVSLLHLGIKPQNNLSFFFQRSENDPGTRFENTASSFQFHTCLQM